MSTKALAATKAAAKKAAKAKAAPAPETPAPAAPTAAEAPAATAPPAAAAPAPVSPFEADITVQPGINPPGENVPAPIAAPAPAPEPVPVAAPAPEPAPVAAPAPEPAPEDTSRFEATLTEAFHALVKEKVGAGLPRPDAVTVARRQIEYDLGGAPAEIKALAKKALDAAVAATRPAK